MGRATWIIDIKRSKSISWKISLQKIRREKFIPFSLGRGATRCVAFLFFCVQHEGYPLETVGIDKLWPQRAFF